mmetsp:Transcript_20502/g.32508  ORF Transcript_20502/g.32508 Transcript_20502/m.32508 type:complete len:214 (-) Transcript_20502:488-1129(-)
MLHFAIRDSRREEGTGLEAQGRSGGVFFSMADSPLDSSSIPLSRNLSNSCSRCDKKARARGWDHRLLGSLWRILAFFTVARHSSAEHLSHITSGRLCSREYDKTSSSTVFVLFSSICISASGSLSSTSGSPRVQKASWVTAGVYPHTRQSLVLAVAPVNGMRRDRVGSLLSSFMWFLFLFELGLICASGNLDILLLSRLRSDSIALISDVNSS